MFSYPLWGLQLKRIRVKLIVLRPIVAAYL